MPSTRNQRAKERQADLMSDVENSDVMLGSYSRNELENNSEDGNIIEVNLGSDRPRQDVVQNIEDLRSLLNSNSRENSQTTLETVRLVNTELTRRIEELKRDLNSQIIESINSAINEKILPSIRNTLGSQKPDFGKVWTIGPVELAGPPKVKIEREHGKTTLK